MAINWGRSIGWNIERSKMEITERFTDGPDCYPWRKTFAYWPVKTITKKYVWMKTVYKRRSWVVWGHSFHMEPEVEYAELFDMLKSDVW